MRRMDRALSDNEALKIIDKSAFGVISCADDDKIFSVPISIVRDDMSVFIHGAPSGTKARLLKDGKDVELVCVIDAVVPNFSEEKIDELISQNKASNIFTTEYKSVVASTKAYEITDDERKIYALKILSQKLTPKYMRAFDKAIQESLKRTKIWELKIENLSAKAKIL